MDSSGFVPLSLPSLADLIQTEKALQCLVLQGLQIATEVNGAMQTENAVVGMLTSATKRRNVITRDSHLFFVFLCGFIQN